MREEPSQTTPTTAEDGDKPPPGQAPVVWPDPEKPVAGEPLRNGAAQASFHPAPVVGLGGSAGSLAALRTFFSHLPADSGLAFVVVMHLSPDHESQLASVLQHVTAMPVVQVRESAPVAANHVYVIPPARQLSMREGMLQVSDLELQPGKRVAIDLFFRTLADTHGPNAAAVVLSGMDGDGCAGFKRIKEHGGLTIVQDPREAQYGDLPRAAIATRLADWVLPVAEIPARLLAYRRRGQEAGPSGGEAPGEAPPATVDDGTALREILAFLRERTGHDFSDRRHDYLSTRLDHRRRLHAAEGLSGYLDFLRGHPEESDALAQDLLMPVSNFFRGGGAFEALRGQLPRLFAGKRADDQVRVWVAGCATGEEAYSVAMLLREYAATLDAAPSLRIFATDIDGAALATARAGWYAETIAADVPPERLRRFFREEPQGYRVRRELREIVLFASQNLLGSFPISRLDLLTCRNLLSKFDAKARKHLFALFHFALRPEGILFLGADESAEDATALFGCPDDEHRFYDRLPAAESSLPIISLSPRAEFEKVGDPMISTTAAAVTALLPRGGLEPDELAPDDLILICNTLQARNEELEARHEELLSATAEMETSREELQLMNGEFVAVNQELKSNIEELACANSDLQNLMASTNIATVFLDRELRIQRYTPSAVRLFHLIPADAGRPLSDLSHHLDYPDLVADARGVLATLAAHEKEVRQSGGEGWLMARLQPYRTTENRVAGVVLTFMDISERKRTEAELVRTAERLSLAMEASRSGTWDWDMVTGAILWSPEHNELYGLPRDRHWGNYDDWLARVHPDDREPAAAALRAAIAGRWDFSCEMRSLRPEGGVRWIAGNGRAFYDETGKPVRMLGVVRDITPRKEAEADLRANETALRTAKEEAERANAAKSVFLSRMSHELRTPLNAILGFGQLLALNPRDEADEESVAHILKGGRHLLSLIDEVLDLARVESGELALKLAAVPLGRITRECASFVARMAQARAIACSVEVNLACEIPVWADEQRLRQVLLNLLSNAIKYNREGGRVTLICEECPGKRVRLKVVDTGPGLSPEDLSRLFVPFERLGHEYGEIEGSGLGLVVSQRLMQAMGGGLGAESQPGQGSTFWVELPAALEARGLKKESDGGGATPPVASKGARNAKVLYIEDNLSNLQVLQMVIARHRSHWQFLSAKDGPGGLEQARAHQPDIILLDLQLPGMRGEEVLGALRADPATAPIPVVLLSADATAHSRDRLLSLGADGYVSKPYNIAELLTEIEVRL